METLLSILVAIIGGLGFLLYRQSKQNVSLKADKSLTDREKDSTIVDTGVDSAKQEIEKLESDKDNPVDDGFWDEYLQDKSRK